MINIDVSIIKDIPTKDITKFEDRVVYNAAMYTREYTKNLNAYPELTGELKKQEIKAPITGSNGSYELLDGTTYAKCVYKMKGVKWTNKSTIPQWYDNVYKKKQDLIMEKAKQAALKELS